MINLFCEPLIRVGICEDAGFGLHLHGRYDVNASEDMITYQPLEASAYAEVDGVCIGRSFHWESRRTMRFSGIMQFIRRNDKKMLLNILKAEPYLQCVVGSEMHPDAPSEFVKAHAIIARSWLIKMLNGGTQCVHQPHTESQSNFISWTTADSHTDFDVCNDDHCQRYQGLDAVTDNAKAAVESTRGMVLTDENDEIVDARYSKCCGGDTELFSSCWEDKDYPYLVHKKDPYCHPDRLKAASRKHNALLKDYDALTLNYYEWQTDVPQSLIRQNIKQYFNIDVGTVTALVPLRVGPSGRIVELRIVGDKKSIVVGKELVIRRLLSDKHLLSSAFKIEKNSDSFHLQGKGWGHGVGLCQIGAAVMAAEGKTCSEILAFYYPDTKISTIYK